MDNEKFKCAWISNSLGYFTYAESGVKRRVQKLLMECSIQQLHKEIITSPDDGGLIGARHADKNDVIISDKMLCYLAPSQLRPMINHHKMMCGYAICNTSKYFQESFNVRWRKQLKIMKDKADNSHGSEKYELTQAYKSYSDYAFPNYETCHPRYKNAENSVLCTPTKGECQFPYWKCVMRECTACTCIYLPGAVMYLSKRAPMIMFNTYITHFTCSHHGILIGEKSPLVWMLK